MLNSFAMIEGFPCRIQNYLYPVVTPCCTYLNEYFLGRSKDQSWYVIHVRGISIMLLIKEKLNFTKFFSKHVSLNATKTLLVNLTLIFIAFYTSHEATSKATFMFSCGFTE